MFCSPNIFRAASSRGFQCHLEINFPLARKIYTNTGHGHTHFVQFAILVFFADVLILRKLKNVSPSHHASSRLFPHHRSKITLKISTPVRSLTSRAVALQIHRRIPINEHLLAAARSCSLWAVLPPTRHVSKKDFKAFTEFPSVVVSAL